MEKEAPFHLRHEQHTDVLHVDLFSPAEGAVIDAVEVGRDIGFPGQIVARVDRERQVLLGVTIQNFSAFRRRLLWRYRMTSLQRALEFLVGSLQAGMHTRRPEHVSA